MRVCGKRKWWSIGLLGTTTTKLALSGFLFLFLRSCCMGCPFFGSICIYYDSLRFALLWLSHCFCFVMNEKGIYLMC